MDSTLVAIGAYRQSQGSVKILVISGVLEYFEDVEIIGGVDVILSMSKYRTRALGSSVVSFL